MTTVDPAYVAYLVRQNAWLRAQLQQVCGQLEELRAVLLELRIEAEVLEARAEKACGAPRARGLGVETTPGDPFAGATDVVRLPPSPRPPPPLDGSP